MREERVLTPEESKELAASLSTRGLPIHELLTRMDETRELASKLALIEIRPLEVSLEDGLPIVLGKKPLFSYTIPRKQAEQIIAILNGNNE